MKMFLGRLKLQLFTIPLHRFKWLGSLESRVVNTLGAIPDADGKRSVYFFSTHKCASTFLNTLIRDLALREGKQPIDIETYLAINSAKRDELYANTKFTLRIFTKRGYYFGVFRHPFATLPEPSRQKIVLVLRDPRDVLTSQYFSIAFSHPVLTPKFLQKRKHALEVGIDKHVVEMSERFLKTYSGYLSAYNGREDVLLIRYEDMISDFHGVLARILEFIEHPKKSETIKYWLQKDPFVVKGEDAGRHKRKITPGDHKEKLKNETISFLNEKFKDILSSLGYCTS